MDAINDPDHPEHERWKDWIGGEWDAEEFDRELFNDILEDTSWENRVPVDEPDEYDLKTDPHEGNNVYRDSKYREVVRRLTRKLMKKKQTLGDTDEAYPELQKRFRETTVVEEMK